MHSDEPFLRMIVATPDDDAPRHIYADYLEEAGDVRAQYVRLAATVQPIQYFDWVSESRRELYVERFPKLKALADAWDDAKSRRIAMQRLRAGIEPGWLAIMDTFGCLRQPFEFFDRSPIESIPSPNPFVEKTHGDLMRHVSDNRVWYVFLHDWEQNSGGRQKGREVVLLAVGLSPHGNRLIGAISHQNCHNLCD